MTHTTKRAGLILLGAALVSLVVLAVSLSNLLLTAGNPAPLSGEENTTLTAPDAPTAFQTISFSFLYGLLALAFLVLVIYITARLILFVNMKVILRAGLALGIVLALLYFLPRFQFQQRTVPPGEFPAIVTFPAEGNPPQTFETVPPAVLWLVIGALGLGLILPVIQILRQRSTPTLDADPLLQEFENAALAIQSGLALKNVILRSYFQMAKTLQEERGLERDLTMTVREFEHLVVQKGYPAVPIHRLTELFEKARYGDEPLSDQDEKTALACLNKIVAQGQMGRLNS